MRKTLLLTPIVAMMMVASLVTADVRDNAGFFTSNAIERADQLISQMKQRTGRDLVIETLPTIPREQRAQLDQLGTNRFFQQYTARRARLAGIDGVYVLATREPSHLQVAVGDSTRQRLFTDANRDQLRDTLVSNFRTKNYDQGLLDGVSYVQRTITANATSRGGAAAAAAAPSGNNSPTLQTFPGNAPSQQSSPRATPAPVQRSSGHSVLFWLILLVGGFFVLMMIIRRFAARASMPSGYGQTQYPSAGGPPPLPGQYPQQQYPGAAGGGFGRGLLGGLLGGAAGGWLYDRMSHPRNTADASSFPGQSPSSPPALPDYFPDTPHDSDFSSSSSGGDFGGGGGDFGDAGGGDSGGGGDF